MTSTATPMERIYACADAAVPLRPTPDAFRAMLNGVAESSVVSDVESLLRRPAAPAARGAGVIDFVLRCGPSKPAWRLVGAPPPPCALAPAAHVACWQAVLLADPLGAAPSLSLPVCSDCLKDVLAVAYFAAFRLPHADVYTAGGMSEREVAENYAQAKRAAQRSVLRL